MCHHRHHSIYCILPPHILSNIIRNGTAEERNVALQALNIDHSLRAHRSAFSLLGNLRASQRAFVGNIAPTPKRTIYDAKHSTTLPGTLVRGEGQEPVADESVNRAYDGLGATFDFYWSVYERNSIDNAGLPLQASVHYGEGYDNAFWDGQQMVFGDGDGVIFNDFTISVDVIGHELTHGVTGSEANFNYQGQPGALNESISDVFGSLIKQYALKQTADQADWLIGDGLLAKGINGVALRSMKAPGTAYDDPTLGKDPQPGNMSGYVNTTEDNGGVHINSGIPNHAFYLLAIDLGGNAWDHAGQIWYDALCDDSTKSTSTFLQFATATSIHAGHRYGATSVQRKAVIDAWNQVGVKVSDKALSAK